MSVSELWIFQLFCSQKYVTNMLVVKNPPANTEGTRDVGKIPRWERSPGGGNGNHSSILAWEIPWSEETGGLQSRGSQRLGHDWATEYNPVSYVGLLRPKYRFSYYSFVPISSEFSPILDSIFPFIQHLSHMLNHLQ